MIRAPPSYGENRQNPTDKAARSDRPGKNYTTNAAIIRPDPQKISPNPLKIRPNPLKISPGLGEISPQPSEQNAAGDREIASCPRHRAP